MQKYSKYIPYIILAVIFICAYFSCIVSLETESRENAKNGICTCGATEYCIGD